jgi:putative transposase
MKKRFTEEQIIAVLREAEAGAKVAELLRKHGISEATLYNWKAKYGGMTMSDAKRLKELETESWSMDFVSDGLANGRRLRCRTIVDDCTRECLAIEIDTSLPGTRVAATLYRLAELRGLPKSITVDHGPEFEGRSSMRGPMRGACAWRSSARASRWRTATSRASTAGCATNA